MRTLRVLLVNGTWRAFAVLALLAATLAMLAHWGKVTLTSEVGFSILQDFSTFGPVALGLGLTMLVREFDISIGGLFGLGGCVAVLVGDRAPLLGIVAAIAVGIAWGAAQGYLMVRLRLGSVAITLGGLLTANGIAAVLTGNKSVPMANLGVALVVNTSILHIFSLRSLVAVGLFIVVAAIISFTRIGRDIIATGSDRQASALAGVSVRPILIGVFTASAAFSALAGALLSYGLSAASPAGLADVSIPAVAAVILGGASLSGGAGRPLGTAAGVLIVCLLRTGITALGVSPFVQDLTTGAILLVMAIFDGQDFLRRASMPPLFRSAVRAQAQATTDRMP